MLNLLKPLLLLILLSCMVLSGCHSEQTVTPERELVQQTDIETAIQEWQAMRFGLFIHFGAYADLAGVWQGKQIEKLGEQIQRHADISQQDYQDVVKQFNPEQFDADAIARLAKQAGMRYIVLTAKHHDGFAMFDSKHSNFDIVDYTPYKKDLLKELAEATKRHGLKLGLYYSTPDWHFNGPHPERNPTDGKISVFGKVSKANEDFQVAQLEELMTNYGSIVEVFFDMGEPTLAQSKRFRDVVKKYQPTALINGRVMNNQGDFLTMPDNHVPDSPITEFPWETPGTFYHTWGYKSWVKGLPLAQQIKVQIRKLSDIASMGGNFLLNIGPKGDGSILAYEKEVLKGVGQWVEKNKEAVFDTGLNPFLKLDWGQVTTGDNSLYLHVHHWPDNNRLLLPGLENKTTEVSPLTAPTQSLKFIKSRGNTLIDLSNVKQDKNLTIIKLDYVGSLSIVPKHVKADSENQLVLMGKQATKHGKFGKQSYRSMLKDFYRSWYVDIPQSGRYQVEVSYKMKYKNKDFVIKNQNTKLAFSIAGKGQKRKVQQLFDGNEVVKKTTLVKGKYQTVVVGDLLFEQSGIQELQLRQGQPFELKANSEDFFNQDQKYRSMNIEIDTIKLTPQVSKR